MSLKSVLLVPDVHVPFEDKRAYDLVLEVATDINVDAIILGGDFGEFYNFSTHGKNPDILKKFSADDEIFAIQYRLSELDLLFPKADKTFIFGNHEKRVLNYLANNAPEIYGADSIEKLLNLKNRKNWKYVQYGPRQMHSILGSKLYVKHVPPASSAKASASKALCSLWYNHIHTIEEAHLVGLDGTNHVCFSVGWLGDKEKYADVFDYTSGHQQWQKGFGIAYIDTKTKYFYHQKHHILDNYTTVVNGKSYKG